MILVVGGALVTACGLGGAVGWYTCVASFRGRIRAVEIKRDRCEVENTIAQDAERERRAVWERETRRRIAVLAQERQDMADAAVAGTGASGPHRKWATALYDFEDWFNNSQE